jgi:hypothetical protein
LQQTGGMIPQNWGRGIRSLEENDKGLKRIGIILSTADSIPQNRMLSRCEEFRGQFIQFFAPARKSTLRH